MQHSDPTAYQALNTTKEPGTIWKAQNERKYLILKDHGAWSNVLVLWDEYRSGCVEIADNNDKRMYTNPSMLTFMFNSALCEYCGSDPLLIVEQIKNMAADALGLPAVEELKACKEHCKLLQKELAECEENRRAAWDTVAVYKTRAAEASVPAPDPEAAMYKRMYYELLDRIVQRG